MLGVLDSLVFLRRHSCFLEFGILRKDSTRGLFFYTNRFLETDHIDSNTQGRHPDALMRTVCVGSNQEQIPEPYSERCPLTVCFFWPIRSTFTAGLTCPSCLKLGWSSSHFLLVLAGEFVRSKFAVKDDKLEDSFSWRLKPPPTAVHS